MNREQMIYQKIMLKIHELKQDKTLFQMARDMISIPYQVGIVSAMVIGIWAGAMEHSVTNNVGYSHTDIMYDPIYTQSIK